MQQYTTITVIFTATLFTYVSNYTYVIPFITILSVTRSTPLYNKQIQQQHKNNFSDETQQHETKLNYHLSTVLTLTSLGLGIMHDFNFLNENLASERTNDVDTWVEVFEKSLNI